jgi:hypothetical protein
VADPLFDALIAGETAREAELRKRGLREAGDAERFRLWFSGRDGKTLDEWRCLIDTVLNLAPKEIV